ncbi:GNAT family N-acetyltransferase [Metabacillus sp. KIGAM252]|uniref:GNAT family N-acetyltransferase n=1 Tax=Metabacillus flavus TaxID=2823519 RepID=A0ABS5LCW6_9BACI|nr:GNAT family protein [Metabacillus flavus]MBS2968580.1 GNAT family N-acetyltransferase [Metabacillus flavus]
MNFPELKTERLKLREINEEDADNLFEIFSKENVLKYYGMEPLRELTEAKLLARRFHDGWHQETSLRWGMEYNEQLIGTIGYHNWNKTHKRAEIGYEIHPDFWRMGFASEALQAAAWFGFKTLGLHRIGATVRPENKASLLLLEKFGFKREGILKGYQYIGGEYYDLVMLSIVAGADRVTGDVSA